MAESTPRSYGSRKSHADHGPGDSQRGRREPTPDPRSRPPTALLFAYGTLMRGYALYPVLARGATFVEEGCVRGRLLDLGPYPGLVDGRRTVRGEVYRVDAPEVLPALDRQEGYNFDRRPATVTLASGRRARAWAYWYRGSQHRAVAIPDGDFRRAHPPGGHQ